MVSSHRCGYWITLLHLSCCAVSMNKGLCLVSRRLCNQHPTFPSSHGPQNYSFVVRHIFGFFYLYETTGPKQQPSSSREVAYEVQSATHKSDLSFSNCYLCCPGAILCLHCRGLYTSWRCLGSRPQISARSISRVTTSSSLCFFIDSV